MVRQAKFEDRIAVEKGHIVRIVSATWKKTRTHDAGKIDVYKIDDSGKEYCKHLAYNCYTGWVVWEADLDDERWDDPNYDLTSFRNMPLACQSWSKWTANALSEKDREKILRKYPEFKWTLQKYDSASVETSIVTAMNMLIAWRKSPKVELLVGAKLFNLFLNKTFAKMTNEKQKAVLSFIRENPESKTWPLQKILFVLKGKGDGRAFDEWQSSRNYGKVLEYKWYCKYRKKLFNKYGFNHALVYMYNDYISMAKEVGHDVKDEYWKYPKDIKKAHDKVMVEHNNYMEAKRISEEKAASERERNKKKNFEKVAKEMSDSVLKKFGLVAYVPKDYKTIRHQGSVLHQCLVNMDYYGRMADKALMLVFIADSEGKPVATAEIKPDMSIGQFYGDQETHDFELMKPSEQARKLLDAWISKYYDNAKNAMAKEAA